MENNGPERPAPDFASAAPAPDTVVPEVAESPRIRSAADAVRRAEAELKKARELYERVRAEAADRLKAVRDRSLGDLIDGTLETVKKHPGPGVLVAMLVGFFLGRLFRR